MHFTSMYVFIVVFIKITTYGNYGAYVVIFKKEEAGSRIPGDYHKMESKRGKGW